MTTTPTNVYLVAIAVVTTTALAYEVLLMRLFSIIQWHHFAYMIISLSLLGYGISGVFIAINRHVLQRYFSTFIVVNVIMFSLAMPFCFLLAQQLPFNPLELVANPIQMLYLFCVYLILTLPFFFVSNVIGLSFYHYKQHQSSLYAADLLGAGLGSVVIIILLFLLFPQTILKGLLWLGLLAAVIVVFALLDNKIKWHSLIVIIGISATVLIPNTDLLNVSPYKSQNQLMTLPGMEEIAHYSSPLGLVNVVKSNAMPLRHAPGLSLRADQEPPEQVAVFTDFDNMTAITAFDGDLTRLAYLDQTTSALPYHLMPPNEILILGSGTGNNVLQALIHDVNHIDAVELNPQISDLVKTHYADFAGHIYSHPKVTLHTAEARGFVASSTKKYDLISLSLMDAFGSSAAGLYSMAENYLYTEQAIQHYLQHLNHHGYLSLTRWLKLPARDMPKLLTMIVNVLKQNTIAHPEQHILIIRSWQTDTLIVKKGVITPSEIDQLKQFCQDRNFDLVFYPGISESEANHFTILKQPYFYQAAQALLSDNANTFTESYKFNIKAATDEKPYFFQFFKWRTLPEIMSLADSGGLFLLESGYLLLVLALIQAIFASLLLIVLPLVLCKRRLGITSGKGHKQVLIYFFSLGIAFLFIEIGFIQKFILILHHPIYAITTVLSVFLISAGLGSQFSRRIEQRHRYIILIPIVMIALLSVIYSLNFDVIATKLLAMNDINRYIGSVLLILPLGFFMGMPFPMGLTKLAQTLPELIPWAWGINGFSSVISAILASLIAMQFGFTALIMLAVIIYGVAGYAYPNSKT